MQGVACPRLGGRIWPPGKSSTSGPDLAGFASEGLEFGAVSHTVLGGSWVVISGVISSLLWVLTMVTLLITPPTTAHEPPSNSDFALDTTP